MRLELIVASNNGHPVALDGLPSFPCALMRFQRSAQNIDRDLGRQIIFAERMFPDLALRFAQVIGWLPPDCLWDSGKLRRNTAG
jgi:hypothetical protein